MSGRSELYWGPSSGRKNKHTKRKTSEIDSRPRENHKCLQVLMSNILRAAETGFFKDFFLRLSKRKTWPLICSGKRWPTSRPVKWKQWPLDQHLEKVQRSWWSLNMAATSQHLWLKSCSHTALKRRGSISLNNSPCQTQTKTPEDANECLVDYLLVENSGS